MSVMRENFENKLTNSNTQLQIKDSCQDTYKILANIASWMMLLPIAGFMVRTVARHGKL
jgi:hypothetical protein